jgi:nitroreductase
MNETLKTILNRRSIRAYKLEQIKDEELQTILEAGKFAPSGMNTQPWHFSVIQNKDLLNKINGAIKDGLLKSGNPQMAGRAKAEDFSIYYHAPTLIIVSADPKVATPQFDSALALGNMFLAAASLGVASCWIHAVSVTFNAEPAKSMLKELAVPDGYTIYGTGAFGYSAVESPSPAPRKDGLITILH